MERNSIENDSILCCQFVILVAAEFEIKKQFITKRVMKRKK